MNEIMCIDVMVIYKILRKDKEKYYFFNKLLLKINLLKN